MDKKVIFYLSVYEGISNPSGRESVAYYGKVYRIPRGAHGTIRQLEWEMRPEELLPQQDSQQANAPQRLPGGIIERFEIYDQDSGDVWVMYRVPCRA